ncbi:hypothetical protein CathTA2_0410 [Caldalkalibacillus thermarum TA2.A1]|uniref:Uncharacterized protein n=1 Tax=Caldalkalibacillus thermarum (strain TA2.A1) TaxID=986075 RepID=F5L3Q1_CALTT|nr:hypothetical protein [Caldalkalibacillus thermarum]EGL84041.1 hypothetical protein CathTA2_0410 [Caldalkalibacillus thermarum TA2.A1]QZT32454.1 hypothetical protein HUR95_08445 [Caldalkalibacillus thermarum TA2.A1]
MSNEPLIQVEQAGKAFLQQGQMVRILNNISFQVGAGQEIVAQPGWPHPLRGKST